jgi:hypothetical protein
LAAWARGGAGSVCRGGDGGEFPGKQGGVGAVYVLHLKIEIWGTRVGAEAGVVRGRRQWRGERYERLGRDEQRRGPSTPSVAKCATDSAQDDGFILPWCFLGMMDLSCIGLFSG